MRVKNAGEYDAYESVLLFVRCLYREITPPVKELKAFCKIFLKRGEEKEVKFSLSSRDFEYYGKDMKKTSARGKHRILIADLSVETDVDFPQTI